MAAKATSLPEERPRPEDDPSEEARDRTQGRASLPTGLDRVQVAARGSRHTRFTALLHHVDEAALLRAFQRQRRAASAGVDGMTVERYERDLERNIRDLCDRVHSGRYRPQPVRRTYIPKADGGHRPLGVPALEDKIVQGAVAEVLSGHCHVGDFYLPIARRAYRPHTGKSMAWGVPRWHCTPPESAIFGERDNAV
jgi:RNA-directed DNA polymerase